MTAGAPRRPHHGLSRTHLYSIWHGLCLKDNLKLKRIEMHPPWKKDFREFLAWAIQTGYQEDLGTHLVRVDETKGNVPGNVMWNIKIESTQHRGKRLHAAYLDEFRDYDM